MAMSTMGSPILCNGGTTTITVTAMYGDGVYTGTGTFTVGETVHQPNVASSVATGVVTFANSTYLTMKTITGDFVANTATDANRAIQGANSSATANATAVNIEIL